MSSRVRGTEHDWLALLRALKLQWSQKKKLGQMRSWDLLGWLGWLDWGTAVASVYYSVQIGG